MESARKENCKEWKLKGNGICKEWNLQGNRLASKGYIFSTLLMYVNECSEMVSSISY